jgi:uncharacterized protein YndB with AHSA1/START domain
MEGVDDAEASARMVLPAAVEHQRRHDRPAPRRRAFNFTIRSPEGEEFPHTNCLLDIVPNERLIFTDTLIAGYRPSPNPFLSFTSALLLTRRGSGTHYVAIAIHGNAATQKKHEEMGFHDGWGTVATQMVEFIKSGGLDR